MLYKRVETFYYFFRPIGIMYKCLGLFPIGNVTTSNSKQLVFRWCSFAVLYSLFIFFGSVFAVWFTSKFLLFLINTPYSLVILVILGRSALAFFFCMKHAKYIPQLIQLLDAFDRKIIEFEYESRNICVSVMTRTIGPLFGGLVLLGGILVESTLMVYNMMPSNLEQKYWFDINDTVTPYIFGFLNTWQIVPLLIYIYFTVALKTSFDEMTKTLKKKNYSVDSLLSDIVPKIDENDFLKTVENLRFMHSMLAQGVNKLGRCFGNFMAVDQFCIIVMVVANVATSLNSGSFLNQQHLLGLTLINGLIVLGAIGISDKMKESASDILDILQTISVGHLSYNCRTEIENFKLQIAVRPIEVSAGGYFIIDKRQVGSVSQNKTH